MKVLVNHCWCSDSNWGGHYDCRVVVSLDRVPEGKTYYDPPDPDWVALLDDITSKTTATDDILRLKPEVLQWLTDNIPDHNGQKGWAIGTDKYNLATSITFRFFFQKPTDAKRFIARWSFRKKPLEYFNYFKDFRLTFNPKTGCMTKA
jgi:hypothetical protein